VDDYVLVHVGMALSIVDEKEAAEVFSYLKEMGDLAELDPPVTAAGAASPNRL
jgi:hydrogenase expression/formation protein HypC